MNNQTYEITIDTKKSHCHSNIEFSQNNLNISELIFNITEDEKEFPLKDTDKIIVYFRKPDKTVVFQDKEVVLLDKAKGKIKVLLTTQTLAKSGDVHGEISIERVESGTKKRVSTYGFTFKVRSSIASNDSIESTNEFQVFDKIIKVGEKFEGVDIDGIITAGELAKGALPKTGGTMTGNLKFNTSGGNREITATDGTNDLYSWIMRGTNFEFFSKTLNKGIFNYNNSTGMFNITADANVLKTTGGTMTGNIEVANTRGLYFQDADKATVGALYQANGDVIFRDIKNSNTVFTYSSSSKSFNVPTDTNLLKKTGDTMTGDIIVENSSGFSTVRLKSGDWLAGWQQRADGLFRLIDWKKNASVLDYNPGTNQVTFRVETNLVKKTGDTLTGTMRFANAFSQIWQSDSGKRSWVVHHPDSDSILFAPETVPNSGIWDWAKGIEFKGDGTIKMAKDGRAELTLTADAITHNSGYTPIADRRGNTVTVRMAVQRVAGSTNKTIATLPADMRPTVTVLRLFTSTDGSIGLLTIGGNGDIWLESSGSSSILGKNFYITITYVVN